MHEATDAMRPMFNVRPAQPSDSQAWLQLRCAFWPDGSQAEHEAEIAAFFSGDSPQLAAVLVAEDEARRIMGLVELSVRPCAEGCRTSRVAYLEGWYVAPDSRRLGAGRALVHAAEEWGREQGCSEFASDALADNEESARAHLALGFADAGLVRCFRKDLWTNGETS